MPYAIIISKLKNDKINMETMLRLFIKYLYATLCVLRGK